MALAHGGQFALTDLQTRSVSRQALAIVSASLLVLASVRFTGPQS
jgi:hypothetical protein